MMRLRISGSLIILLGLCSITCDQEEVTTRSYPAIDTKAVTDINEGGANLNATILNSGNSGIKDHGFVYDDTSNPTIDNSDRISLGETGKEGNFSAFVNRNLVKDRRYFVKAYAITKNNNYVVYGQQIEFVSLGGSAPEIKSFTPTHGSIGDTILITGTGFSDIETNNSISFGPARSLIYKSTSDSLWCIVPDETPIGENVIKLVLGQFTVIPEPKFLLKTISLTSFLPKFASLGDTITVTGINFPLQGNFITMLEKEARVVSNTSTELKVIVPTNSVIPKSVLSIKAGLQTLISSEELYLLKPIISGFAPSKGTNDTEVEINGNYFSPVAMNNKVEINGTSLTVIQASKTTLKVKIPSGMTPGNYHLSITVATQNTESSNQFEIIKPTITNVNPTTGTWGNTVTISGENFGNSISANIVKFNDAQATIVSASSNEIRVLVPNNLLNKNSILSVQAITTDNIIVEHNTQFTLDAPAITSFTPEEGKSKSQITIYGENFNPLPDNHIVRFGDRLVEVLSATSNQLVVKLPTSLIDSDVEIQIDLAEQSCFSSQLFHIISPWRRLEDYPGGNTANATGFAVLNKGYVGLGEEQLGHIKPIWEYNPTTNSWTQPTEFYWPGDGIYGPYVNMISFVIDNYAYVGLGSRGGWPQAPEGKIRKYTPSSNIWIDVMGIGNNPSVYATDGAVSYTANGKGYVTTGREKDVSNQFPFDGPISSKMWEYDPSTDTWVRKKDLPATGRWEATGFSIESKLYLMGGAPCRGCSGESLLSDFWEYDTSSDTWIRLSDFPGGRRMMSTGFVINEIGYIMGGSEGNAFFNDFWMFRQDTKTWIQLENFPGGTKAAATNFVLNGKAYIGTGYGNDFWEFDPLKL